MALTAPRRDRAPGRLPTGTRDAEHQLDALTRTYTRHTHYYGEIYPLDQRNLKTRVIARLHPRALHWDAIHR